MFCKCQDKQIKKSTLLTLHYSNINYTMSWNIPIEFQSNMNESHLKCKAHPNDVFWQIQVLLKVKLSLSWSDITHFTSADSCHRKSWHLTRVPLGILTSFASGSLSTAACCRSGGAVAVTLWHKELHSQSGLFFLLAKRVKNYSKQFIQQFSLHFRGSTYGAGEVPVMLLR